MIRTIDLADGREVEVEFQWIPTEYNETPMGIEVLPGGPEVIRVLHNGVEVDDYNEREIANRLEGEYE